MSKWAKIWLITAALLILIGCAIFGGVMTVFNWDFSKLSTVQYETNSHVMDGSYKNISVITDTADVVFAPSENAKTTVACYELKNAKHTVTVKDGTLVIAVEDTRKWYEYIGIGFDAPRITVCLPQGAYGSLSIESDTGDVVIPKDFTFESIAVSESTGDVRNSASASGFVKIQTSTGNIRVENIAAGSLDLSVSTGSVTVSQVTCGGDVKIRVSTGRTTVTDTTCQNVVSGGSTGDISLKNVIAAEKLSVERSTGDVHFDGADAAGILVKTSTGNVKGSLLSGKVFVTQSDTGRVNVPETTAGGRCEIHTDTGDITLTIQ